MRPTFLSIPTPTIHSSSSNEAVRDPYPNLGFRWQRGVAVLPVLAAPPWLGAVMHPLCRLGDVGEECVPVAPSPLATRALPRRRGACVHGRG